jgi:hypothetical protein
MCDPKNHSLDLRSFHISEIANRAKPKLAYTPVEPILDKHARDIRPTFEQTGLLETNRQALLSATYVRRRDQEAAEGSRLQAAWSSLVTRVETG